MNILYTIERGKMIQLFPLIWMKYKIYSYYKFNLHAIAVVNCKPCIEISSQAQWNKNLYSILSLFLCLIKFLLHFHVFRPAHVILCHFQNNEISSLSIDVNVGSALNKEKSNKRLKMRGRLWHFTYYHFYAWYMIMTWSKICTEGGFLINI